MPDPADGPGFERVLTSSLGEVRQQGGADCPTPEILAASADGSLLPHEAAEIEAHLAECGRCQAVMAAIGRAEEAEPTAGMPGRSAIAGAGSRWRLPWKWIAPIAAVASVLIVWVAVQPGEEMTRPAGRFEQRGADEPVQIESQTLEVDEFRPAEPGSGTRAGAAPSERPVPLAESPPAPSAPAAGREAAARLRAQPLAPPAPATTVAPGAGVTADAPPSSPAPAAEGAPVPESDVGWRFGSNGRIERSTDGGVTWERVESGVTADLLAGDAPSSNVAWIVGRNGTVLRTTDGSTFVQVAFPSTADLTGVQAASPNEAIVTTAAGERFQTRNGGEVWEAVH